MIERAVTERAIYGPALRKLGFKKVWHTTSGGQATTQYDKRLADGRELHVQIWADGGHRVSHSFNGCSDTTPTDFRLKPQMSDAIDKESTRTDSKYYRASTLIPAGYFNHVRVALEDAFSDERDAAMMARIGTTDDFERDALVRYCRHIGKQYTTMQEVNEKTGGAS